jgi:hypothetical protein
VSVPTSLKWYALWASIGMACGTILSGGAWLHPKLLGCPSNELDVEMMLLWRCAPMVIPFMTLVLGWAIARFDVHTRPWLSVALGSPAPWLSLLLLLEDRLDHLGFRKMLYVNLLAVGLVSYGFACWGWRLVRRRRHVPGLCDTCQCDLRGRDGPTCPECGTPISRASEGMYRPQPRRSLSPTTPPN